MEETKILIADTSEIYGTGLQTALARWPHIRVVGRCLDGKETIEKVTLLKPDIVLLDQNITNPNCIEVSKQIKYIGKTVHIVIIIDNLTNDKDPFQVYYTKASGYIDRQTDPPNIISIFKRILLGDFFVSPAQAKKLIDEIGRLKLNQQLLDLKLSKREIEILRHIGDGLSNREIAQQLIISENTVKSHLTRILAKTQLDSRRQLIVAVSKGLWGLNNKADPD
jgi:RNA polymerase sigma factor (sigma-70 family)